MHTEVRAERAPRARYLIPRDLPRRGEALAVAGVLVVLTHVLFAQLTGVLAVALHATGRATRWRLSWLAAPAVAGLAWTLAVGAGPAVAGLLAAPAHLLSYLTGGGAPFAHLTRPWVAFAGLGSLLPRQLPLALVTGSAEAAVAGALSRARSPSRDQRSARPGLIAALRRVVNLRRLRAGELLTRDGAALGVEFATGGPLSLTWARVAGGVLVGGDSEPEVTATAFRLAGAALRRRKPVLVVDLERRSGIRSRLAAACARYGNVWSADIGSAVRDRAVVLFDAAGDAGAAARVCAAVLDAGRDLRRIGADGDGLVWLRGCADLPEPLLAALVAEGYRCGLPLLVSTTDAAAAARLEPLVGVYVRQARGEFTLTVRGGPPVRGIS